MENLGILVSHIEDKYFYTEKICVLIVLLSLGSLFDFCQMFLFKFLIDIADK